MIHGRLARRPSSRPMGRCRGLPCLRPFRNAGSGPTDTCDGEGRASSAATGHLARRELFFVADNRIVCIDAFPAGYRREGRYVWSTRKAQGPSDKEIFLMRFAPKPDGFSLDGAMPAGGDRSPKTRMLAAFAMLLSTLSWRC